MKGNHCALPIITPHCTYLLEFCKNDYSSKETLIMFRSFFCFGVWTNLALFFIGNFWPLFRCFNTHLLMQKVSTLTTWLPPNSVTKLLNYNVFSKRLESQTSDVASTALYYCLTNILLRKRSKITKMPQNYLLFAKYYSSQGCRQTVQTTLALNILF